MSADSLLADLSAVVSDSFRPDNIKHEAVVAPALSNAAMTSITENAQCKVHEGKVSLSQLYNENLNYDGFVRFLADTPVPLVEEFERDRTSLGSGWTVTVYRGIMNYAGQQRAVAVKELNVDVALGLSSVEDQMASFKTKMASILLEIRMMSHELLRNHKNIVRLLGIGWTTRRLLSAHHSVQVPVLLTELASIQHNQALTLEGLVHASSLMSLSIQKKTKLLADVATGIQALHALSVVHGDVKPANVLIFDYDTDMVAKISDFGFSSAGDQDLQAVRGGTADWNAPECLIEAATDLAVHRYEATRDLYSFGLLIWFVLFEELPTATPGMSIHCRTNTADMKHEIDIAFAKRYRVMTYSRNEKEIVQEEYDKRLDRWQPSLTNEQHILRFLMQWLLVRSPTARRHALDLYGYLMSDEMSLSLARDVFESPGEWDRQWHRYGHPDTRLARATVSESQHDMNDTLYALNLDQALPDYGRLRQYEQMSTYQKMERLASKNIPLELRKQIFDSFLRETVTTSGQQQANAQKAIGDCYLTGFGVEKEPHTALTWYEFAAFQKHLQATEAFIRLAGFKSAKEHLGLEIYCQWLCRVLLSTFEAVDTNETQKYNDMINRLRDLLCGNPERAVWALEDAVMQHLDSKDSEENVTSATKAAASTVWNAAVDAIERGDQDALRAAIGKDAQILQGSPEGHPTLTLSAVIHNRAGLLRVLIDDYNADYQSPSTVNRLTPLAYAIRHGHTTSARILASPSKTNALNDALAAMDVGSGGDEDFARFLFNKFAGPSTVTAPVNKSSDERFGDQFYDEEIPGQFGRWSYFAMLSAVMNNNWRVFSSLLSIGVNPNIHTPPSLSSAEHFFAGILVASTSYNPVMLAALLAFGASPNLRIPIPDCRTALHLACGRYFTTNYGRSEGEEERPELARHWNNRRNDVPADAHADLQKFMIDILLTNGAGKEERNYDGFSALAYAVHRNDDLTAATHLLESKPKADINTRDFTAATPLHRAVENMQTEKVEFLLHYGAEIDAQNLMGETPLFIAIKQGDLSMCKRLLVSGANIRATNANGQNCLHFALQHSQMDVAQLFQSILLAHSKVAFEQVVLDLDCRGWSAIHTCLTKYGSDIKAEALLQEWFNLISRTDYLNAQDSMGMTLLHIAVSVGSVEGARALIKIGADVNIKDTVMGWTPLHHACNSGDYEMLNALLEFGADLKLRDDLMGWTPLFLLEIAIDCAKLAGGETWEECTDEEGEDADEIWEDGEGNIVNIADEGWEGVDDSDDERVTKYYELDSRSREHLAQRRVKLQPRITQFHADEMLRRTTRPMKQAVYDRAVAINQAMAFPEHRYLEAASSEVPGTPICYYNERNLPRLSVIDRYGRVRHRWIIFPASSDTVYHSRVWIVDTAGMVRGLAGLSD